MKLNHKDKSLLLLIAATLIVLWGFVSLFSGIFFSTTFASSDVNKVIVKDDKWFNTSRPLEKSDLKDRVILLDFWTYACVNCMQVLSEIKKLEKEFEGKLFVIGVHSGKFSNERENDSIKKAILKHDITHPVVNDADFKIWNNFSVSAWPTMVLIDPHGNVHQTYVGENDIKKLRKDVRNLVSKFKYEISHQPLPIKLERYDVPSNVLDFPTKLLYVHDFAYKTHPVPSILIANSGHNNIIATSLTGNMILKIGSGKDGFEDGDLNSASFSAPQGMLYDSGKIYVADTGNHALRMVNLKDGKVTTLIGSGSRGDIITGENDAAKVNLASPTDIEFFPNKNFIAIANSGTHQILFYDLKKHQISALAGNGSEEIKDGKYPDNSLAQTADMSVFGGKLYFVDAETSSLRVLDESGNVKTLIGEGLFKFGHVNGGKDKAMMQHPLGLLVDDTGAYISDSFNHVIRKYDFSSAQIRDFIGGSARGDDIGDKTKFDEPEGIISVLDRFYIADSNNNRVVVVGRGNLNSDLLNIMPPLKLPKEGFLEYMPNLQDGDELDVAANSEIAVKIDFAKGWKINETGPSFLNLLEMVKNRKANLISSFDWRIVAEKEMKLPKLTDGKDYLLQGSIYYCQDKKIALCYIKNYEQKISADSSEKNEKIEIKLGS